MKLVPISAAVALSLLPAGSGLAATATADMNVRITIQDACSITSATDMDFGTHGVISANVDQVSAINVQCTPLTPYSVALNEGNGAGATIAVRKMTGVSGTINYSLYTDALRTDVWGTGGGGANGSTVGGLGTGLPIPHVVYGRVPPQTTSGAGVYTDVIAVTVTY